MEKVGIQMSETTTLFYGVLLIGTFFSGLLMYDTVQREKAEITRLCARTCIPYFGDTMSGRRCVCDLKRPAEVETEE